MHFALPWHRCCTYREDGDISQSYRTFYLRSILQESRQESILHDVLPKENAPQLSFRLAGWALEGPPLALETAFAKQAVSTHQHHTQGLLLLATQ
jgi:hypothetical protein